MKPDKILYVDDESMALKYFARLAGSLAPIITASSVQEGQAILDGRAGEIAVLISDQRMPGAYGNKLLRYARDHHPSVVRLLTTAHSDLSEAIEAINTGEIYRYLTKPWDLEGLRADLRNALELADLRSERDTLLCEKMLIAQQQVLVGRASQLAIVCTGFTGKECDQGLHIYLEGAARVGCRGPMVDWHAQDHSNLMQAEACRGIALGRQVAKWHKEFGANKSPSAAAAALAKALALESWTEGMPLHIPVPAALYGVLDGATEQESPPEAVIWLAWLTWWGAPVELTPQDGGWQLGMDAVLLPAPLQKNWLAACIEKLGEPMDLQTSRLT